MIWDWNGTLLDDVACSVQSINVVLGEFGLPEVPDLETYRSGFGWPARDYYARLGFDVGPGGNFEAAATRYLSLFAEAVPDARLQPNAVAALETIRARGVRQVLLSATVEATLHRQIAPHGVSSMFDEIFGTADAYTPSKAGIVRDWLAGSSLDAEEIVIIGDTNHDHEIAAALGVRFIAYSLGHQRPPTPGGHQVIDDLALVPGLLIGE